MKDNDQLIFTSPIQITRTFGILGIFGGVVLLYIALALNWPLDWSIAFTLGALVIMFTGFLMLLLQRIHLINRRMLTEGTYLGFIIPFKGTSRNLLKFNQRSIKSFDRVTVRYEETYVSPEPGMDPGGFIHQCHVGLANDQTEIRLATFDSLASAEKHAEEIETFLYSD